MLCRRLIPSLLLRRDRLVKGVAFADHRDAGNPVTTARIHNAQGADELLLLDIDAAREARGPDVAHIAVVARECFMPLTVGGAVRSLADARACMAAGADKLCLTTTALDNPDLIAELAQRFGRQAIMVGIDVVGAGDGWALWDHRTATIRAERGLEAWVREVVARGAGELRLMRVEREGRRNGMDIALLRRVRSLVDVPLVVEGGAGSLDHLDEALAAG
ncbi:MAG: imidazole glycerol phosphate synthase subunit HisF, partial [Alphaproteobacteria bacterium]|nr:imidazole glycerol phosphate synthase subunit HisF [Alphaproteobacteria bacterium]